MKLPQAFIERTRPLLGREWDAFEQALQEETPVSIRFNPYKYSEDEGWPFSIDSTPIEWASKAYRLASRPSFTYDPLFHAGCYYVQEASSMYLEQIIRKQVMQVIRVLDLCAAPGGKSTQLSSLLPEGSLLVANEVIRTRAHILAENLIKWGNPATIVSNNDPQAFASLGGYFDLILADVPCSGEGMFRKDKEAINEWSENNVRLCSQRQRRIVADVWPALKEGGLLVYSTCTYNREENEENIHWICEELGAEVVEEPHRFWPHRSKGEGFFIAALRKTTSQALVKPKKQKPLAGYKLQMSWLDDQERFFIFDHNNRIGAIPRALADDYQLLRQNLKLVHAGIEIGELKGRDLIPAHTLSMSLALNPDAFYRWELDKNTALNYLKKEALQEIPSNLPKGFVLITYQNHPLGFVKNIGNRANNLYPQEWRIRK